MRFNISWKKVDSRKDERRNLDRHFRRRPWRGRNHVVIKYDEEYKYPVISSVRNYEWARKFD